MAEDSPCRRTPSTMPSSVHSMGGVYHVGWAKRSVPTNDQQTVSSRRDGGHGAAAPLPTLLSPHYALNQPLASPVKEKYKPAAVRAQETISMALSSSRPASPMICTSEMSDSTSAANSAQRGQFLRRWAASQTKDTSSRIRPPAITVDTMIMGSVISALGVRSWNATDSASSVSDR